MYKRVDSFIVLYMYTVKTQCTLLKITKLQYNVEYDIYKR